MSAAVTIRRRPDFEIEARLLAAGTWPVAGVDEVGRGPLAGPVAAAAVVLDPRDLPDGLDDSKALDARQREAAFEAILERALAVAVGFASVTEIDAVNIRQATFLAMARAVGALALAPIHVLVDGDAVPRPLASRARAIVRGDATSLSIAAASIVAKVTRDRLMRRLADHHPQYGFHTHVGYATAAHLDAIRAHGPCRHHRMSFSPMRAPADPTGVTKRDRPAAAR